jgi:hypothetical protein
MPVVVSRTPSVTLPPPPGRRFRRLAALFILVIGWSIAMMSGFGGGRPVEAAYAQQYAAGGIPVDPCFAPISDPTATCPWVLSQLPGGRLGADVDHLTPGMIGALRAGGRSLVVEADWLVGTQRDGAWWYSTSVGLRSRFLAAPWKSASTQGLAISVLARAQVLAPNRRYVDAIHAAVTAMSIDRDGWPDEYGDGSRVLSAGMTATLGLYDAWRVADSVDAHLSFQRAVGWLGSNLGSFDRDFQILYATGPLEAPADLPYLHATIAQLQVLGEAADLPELGAKASEWSWRITEPGAFRLQLILATAWYAPVASLVALGSTAVAILLAWPALRRKRHHSAATPPVAAA